MDFTGKVHKILPIQEFKNNFTKRDFVVVDETSQYPQYITFQLVKDRCSLIEKFKEGDVIKVAFNLNGREWIDPKTNEPKYVPYVAKALADVYDKSLEEMALITTQNFENLLQLK